MLPGFFATRDPDWAIRRAFRNGEDGIWVAPRLGGMFQDAALTTPWAADGDPVGGYVDRSPRGYVLTQSTSTSRVRGYGDLLNADGVDDRIYSAAGVLDIGRKMFAVIAYRVPDVLDAGLIFGKNTDAVGTTSYRFRRRGGRSALELFKTTGQIFGILPPADTITVPRIESFAIDRDAGSAFLRRNKTLVGTATWTPESSTTAMPTTPWSACGVSALAADIYEIVQVMRAPIAGEIEAIEARLAVAHGIETGGGVSGLGDAANDDCYALGAAHDVLAEAA